MEMLLELEAVDIEGQAQRFRMGCIVNGYSCELRKLRGGHEAELLGHEDTN
jgi:hypothetical protein